MGFFSTIIAVFVAGPILAVFFEIISEGVGGISFPGTQKRKNINDDIDRRISEKFKNGTGSSKQELQDWWNIHHPEK